MSKRALPMWPLEIGSIPTVKGARTRGVVHLSESSCPPVACPHGSDMRQRWFHQVAGEGRAALAGRAGTGRSACHSGPAQTYRLRRLSAPAEVQAASVRAGDEVGAAVYRGELSVSLQHVSHSYYPIGNPGATPPTRRHRCRVFLLNKMSNLDCGLVYPQPSIRGSDPERRRS